jgi:hypothetical protein
MSSKIKNMEELLAEKERLKGLCKEKEAAIGKQLDYIQNNIGMIALESILPVNQSQKGTASFIVDGLQTLLSLFAPGLSEKFNKSEKLSKIVELLAGTLLTRFFNKKSE